MTYLEELKIARRILKEYNECNSWYEVDLIIGDMGDDIEKLENK